MSFFIIKTNNKNTIMVFLEVILLNKKIAALILKAAIYSYIYGLLT